MHVCWQRLRELPPPDPETDQRPVAFALFVFHGILDSQRERSQEQSKITDVGPWWSALGPLARQIVRDGILEDVYHLVFALREPETIAGLDAHSVIGVVRALGERVGREPVELLLAPSPAAATWPSVIEYGAQVVRNVALALPPADPVVGEFYTMLECWPSEVKGILEAKRDVRQHGGLGG